MAQEVRDGDERDVRLEEMHRLGVAEGVRTDADPGETRERNLGALHVLVQEVACAVARKALPVPVLDHRLCVIFAASCRGEETSHQPSGVRQQGREPFASAFAVEPDKRRWDESDIARRQIQELLDACPRVVEEGHEEVVAFADLRRAIDLREHVCQLGVTEVAEHGTWRLLHGDGEHALTEQREGGLGIEHVAEEAVDGGEPSVARANGIASRGFEVLQEVEDAIGGEVFDVQRGGRPMHRRGQEAQEKLEGIAIRGDGVRTGISLGWEMPREERRDEGREVMRCPNRVV